MEMIAIALIDFMMLDLMSVNHALVIVLHVLLLIFVPIVMIHLTDFCHPASANPDTLMQVLKNAKSVISYAKPVLIQLIIV